MSVFPFQVPTSVFNRSNSGELCFDFGSSAFNATEVANSNIAQTEVIFSFIVFLLFSVICSSFIYTTKEASRFGHWISLFFREKFGPGQHRAQANLDEKRGREHSGRSWRTPKLPPGLQRHNPVGV